jgi:hypothetical protein
LAVPLMTTLGGMGSFLRRIYSDGAWTSEEKNFKCLLALIIKTDFF